MSTVIGLSFGNTTSSIAYIKEGAVEVIANPDGDRAIPSMLAYAHGDEFHGGQAKHQIVRNAANTIGFFRDFLATPFGEIDASVADRLAKPIKASDGGVAFEIQGKQMSIDEIVERQFVRLHDASRDYIGRDIDGVVLALPADVPNARKEKLVALATKAGLPVTQVIGELSAALLAHLSRPGSTPSTEDKTFVVADFGGTSSNAAIISSNSGIFTVVATHSDHKLGGRQLDDSVLAHLAREFEAQYKVDPLKEQRAVSKLVLEAEALRKTLSNSKMSQFGIESVASGFDFSGSLNRLKYEVVARHVFTQFTEFVVALLKKASIDALSIDEVLLVGGVSWTPKIAANLASVFDERTKIVSPSTDTKAVDPDELIARGCAIQGSLIAGLDAEELDQIEHHLNAAHLSKTVGVVIGDKVVPVLGKHTLVPTKKTVTIQGTASSLQIAELEEEIKTTVHKPEPKENKPAEDDDDESDWDDSDEEEYETREILHKPTSVLADVDVAVEGEAKVTLYLTTDQKLQVTIISGGKTVQGSI